MDAGIVIAGAHGLNAPHQLSHSFSEIDHEEAQSRRPYHGQHQGNAENVAAGAVEEGRLLGVIVIDIDGADGHHWGGCIGNKGRFPIAAAEHIAAFQCGYDIGQKSIGPRQGADFGIVINHAAETIGDQNALFLIQIQHLHRYQDILLGQGGELLQSGRKSSGPLQKFCFLGTDNQLAHRLGRIKIQHQKQCDHRDQHGKSDAEAKGFNQLERCCWA